MFVQLPNFLPPWKDMFIFAEISNFFFSFPASWLFYQGGKVLVLFEQGKSRAIWNDIAITDKDC